MSFRTGSEIFVNSFQRISILQQSVSQGTLCILLTKALPCVNGPWEVHPYLPERAVNRERPEVVREICAIKEEHEEVGKEDEHVENPGGTLCRVQCLW